MAAASIGQVYRAQPARRPRGGGEGAVPGRRAGGARRPPEPRADHARGEADRAGHGRQGDDRRDPRAADRRARLRARGAEPARLRARLARPPVHRTCRTCRHRALRRARARRASGSTASGFEEVRQLRPRDARPLRRDRLPLLLRLALPQRALLGRPAPRQLPADGRRPRGVPGLRHDEARRRARQIEAEVEALRVRRWTATPRGCTAGSPRWASSTRPTRRSRPRPSSRTSAT